MKLTAQLANFDALSLKAKYLTDAARFGLAAGVAEAALLFQVAAQERSPVLTGANRDSITREQTVDEPERQEIIIAPHMPYSARLEFGFTGEDSLGRHYDQAPRPYMRPAFDENREEAKERIVDSVRQEVIGAAGVAGARRAGRA